MFSINTSITIAGILIHLKKKEIIWLCKKLKTLDKFQDLLMKFFLIKDIFWICVYFKEFPPKWVYSKLPGVFLGVTTAFYLCLLSGQFPSNWSHPIRTDDTRFVLEFKWYVQWYHLILARHIGQPLLKGWEFNGLRHWPRIPPCLSR